VLLALAVVAALAAAGCDRKPRFVPAAADSTAVRPSDSMAVYVGQARERWESGEGQAAAALTARLVLDDLRLHPGNSLRRRARQFLDSLGMAAEVAGADSLLTLNLFSRSDPTGGSWPYLYWLDVAGLHQQGLEGTGLKLLDLASRRSETGVPQVALLFLRGNPRGQEPLVFVWEQPAGIGGWRLIQSLGSDSLGGTGTAEFVAPNHNNVVMVSRTYRTSARFDECSTCPHVYQTRRFVWSPGGLATLDERTEPSPYASFVDFIQALEVNDRDQAMSLVTGVSLVDAAIGYQWNESRGLWRIAPGTEEDAHEMVFFRGNQEAYRVQFSGRGGEWRITGFQPTMRSVE
jgi:hypothetical protein